MGLRLKNWAKLNNNQTYRIAKKKTHKPFYFINQDFIPNFSLLCYVKTQINKDHPKDEDDLKDEDNQIIEDDPLKENNTQRLHYLAFAAFLMKNLNILYDLGEPS